MQKLLLFILTVGFLCAGCTKNNHVNTECIELLPADTYNYPVVPGMPAWAALHTGDEMLQACQIPATVLSGISTGGLIQSWLEMPIRIDIFSTNSPQKSFVWFTENFSGLKELMTRADAAEKLFEYYQRMKPSCILTKEGDMGKGEFTLRFTYIGLPLGQDVIIDQMSLEQKKLLVKVAIEKANEAFQYPEYFSRIDQEKSWFICARVMRNCGYTPFMLEVANDIELPWFLDNAQFYIPLGNHEKEINIIYSHVLEFIK